MSTEMPVITTVIPTYRRPELLQRAIRSVLAQTYPHLRVAVYDNASGDATEAVVAAMALADPRISYHRHAENIGPTANFAYGIEHVDTPFFSILPDDDYYLPTFFATAMAGFTAHPDAVCSGAGTLYATNHSEIFQCSSAEGYFVPPDGLTAEIAGNYPGIMAYLFRREVVAHLGAMPTVFHWDIEFLWRLLLRFPHVVSNHPSVVVVYHPQQGTRDVDLHAKQESHQAMQRYVDETVSLPPHTRAMVEGHLRAHFGRSVFLQGMRCVANREFSQADQAAAMLGTHFGMARAARIMTVAAAICRRITPLCRVLDWSMTAVQSLMMRLQVRKHRALRAELRAILPTGTTS